jgi:hypothetical protein
MAVDALFRQPRQGPSGGPIGRRQNANLDASQDRLGLARKGCDA